MAKNKNLKKPSLREASRFQIKETPPDHNKSRPIFSLYHMRYGKPYCLSQCGRDDKSHLVNLLLHLSQITWGDICSADRKSFGLEHIPIKKFNATVQTTANFGDVI